jgi:hypothetical protein
MRSSRRERRERRERAVVHLQDAARLLDDERPFSYIAILDHLTHARLATAFEVLVENAGDIDLPAFWRELDLAALELDLYTAPEAAGVRAAADTCRRHAGVDGGGAGGDTGS